MNQKQVELLLGELNTLKILTVWDALRRAQIRLEIARLGFSTIQNKQDSTYILVPLAQNEGQPYFSNKLN